VLITSVGYDIKASNDGLLQLAPDCLLLQFVPSGASHYHNCAQEAAWPEGKSPSCDNSAVADWCSWCSDVVKLENDPEGFKNPYAVRRPVTIKASGFVHIPVPISAPRLSGIPSFYPAKTGDADNLCCRHKDERRCMDRIFPAR
jgi:hypothetical protein